MSPAGVGGWLQNRGNHARQFSSLLIGGGGACRGCCGSRLAFPPAPRTLIVLATPGDFREAFGDIALFVEYDYLPGRGYLMPSGSGSVYELQLPGDPVDLLTELGSVYGVEGVSGPSQYFR
jgi:hypothetical protein